MRAFAHAKALSSCSIEARSGENLKHLFHRRIVTDPPAPIHVHGVRLGVDDHQTRNVRVAAGDPPLLLHPEQRSQIAKPRPEIEEEVEEALRFETDRGARRLWRVEEQRIRVAVFAECFGLESGRRADADDRRAEPLDLLVSCRNLRQEIETACSAEVADEDDDRRPVDEIGDRVLLADEIGHDDVTEGSGHGRTLLLVGDTEPSGVRTGRGAAGPGPAAPCQCLIVPR